MITPGAWGPERLAGYARNVASCRAWYGCDFCDRVAAARKWGAAV